LISFNKCKARFFAEYKTMINLILADDHSVVRQAICEMLEKRGKYRIVAQAENGAELLDLLKQHNADILIVDVNMPKLDGLEALGELRETLQIMPPVLILSADEREQSVRQALSAGAQGYLPKNANIEELEFAIASVLDGKTYLSPSVTASVMARNGSPSSDNPFEVLTRRELEIAQHLANGKPNRDIGKLLHISTRTVDTHRSNIMKKLNVKTNAELVKLAITHNIVTV
jgi:DNA-binding NarL/FixJ family response regulator